MGFLNSKSRSITKDYPVQSSSESLHRLRQAYPQKSSSSEKLSTIEASFFAVRFQRRKFTNAPPVTGHYKRSECFFLWHGSCMFCFTLPLHHDKVVVCPRWCCSSHRTLDFLLSTFTGIFAFNCDLTLLARFATGIVNSVLECQIKIFFLKDEESSSIERNIESSSSI